MKDHRKLLSRVVTGLLCASLLLTACANDGDLYVEDTTIGDTSDTTAETTTVETEPEYKPDLPDVTYDGETIVVFQRNEEKFINDICVEDGEGDTMQSAVYERNFRLSEQYDVTFERVLSTIKTGEDGMDVIRAGDNTYDILVIHARQSFGYASGGLLLDWNTSLPYIDLDNPWWAQDARESLSICRQNYVMVGDISYMNLASTNVMLFNKTIFDENHLEYPYESVLNGDWTFDEFAKLAAQGARDLDGDGTVALETDRLGYVTGPWIGPIQVLYTGGERICTKDENDELVLTLNTERTVDIFDTYFSFLSSAGMHIEKQDVTKLTDAFREGRVMFYDLNVGDIMNLRDMEDDFGIIPWPKYDDTMDDYYTNVDAGCNMLCVPITKTGDEPAMISVILEAMAYDSYQNLIPLYYDVILQSRYSRDEQSTQMLDLIRAGRVYDIGYFYRNNEFCYEINSIGRFLALMETPNFASHYATYEAKAKANLNKINETYRNMGD